MVIESFKANIENCHIFDKCTRREKRKKFPPGYAGGQLECPNGPGKCLLENGHNQNKKRSGTWPDKKENFKGGMKKLVPFHTPIILPKYDNSITAILKIRLKLITAQ